MENEGGKKTLDFSREVRPGRSMKPHEQLTIRGYNSLNAIHTIPSYAIRTLSQKCLYFTGYYESDPMDFITPVPQAILVAVRGPNNIAQLQSILDLAIKPRLRTWSLEPVIDEIDQKLYFGVAKREHDRSITLTIEQYELEFGPVDEFGNTKISVPKPNEPTILLIKPAGYLTGLNISDRLKLFIWPDDGTLLLCGNLDKTAEESKQDIKIAWLERKTKSDRILFARYIDMNISLPAPTCFSIFQKMSRSGTSVSLVFSQGHFPEFADYWQVVTINKQETNSFKCSEHFSIWNYHLFGLLPFKFEMQTQIDALNSARVVGKFFKAWVVAFIGPKPNPPYLVAFRHNRYPEIVCKLKMDTPELSRSMLKPTPFDMIASTLMVTDNPKDDTDCIRIRKIDLSKDKYVREIKMYRVCAKCGVQEQKKRRNKNGKRIADFKVCRDCKKSKILHRVWQHYPCHYCSLECMKADWSKHTL